VDVTEHRKRTRLRADERRETILQAATEVFAEAGYQAGKMSDIAARVGVSEPVVFQNFGSKAALYAAVLERAAAEVRGLLEEVSGEFGDAAGMLAHVLGWGGGGDTPGHTADDVPRTHSPLSVLFADAATLPHPELSGFAQSAMRAIAGHLADLVRAGQADGSLRADVDPDAAGWLLLSLLSAHALRGAAMPAGLERGVAALVLDALTGDPLRFDMGDRG
jgi:AcrR family transcriptional regulator